MRIFIDIFTKNVVGINKTPNASTYIIDTPNINPTKIVERTLTRQQTNEDGLPLYIKQTTYTDSEPIQTIKAFEEVNGEIVYYQPLMTTQTIEQHYKFLDNPFEFTINDIIEAKGAEILKNSDLNNIILKEINQEDLFTESAHVSVDYIKLLPSGTCRTSLINIPQPTDVVGVYLEADNDIEIEVGKDIDKSFKLIDGKVQFSEPVSQVYIKFNNLNTENEKEIKAYGILF